MEPIKHIRVNVFGMSQSEFSNLIGVGQSSVSRWENGTPLSSDEMAVIRKEAIDRNIEWRDDLFFEVPADTVSGAA